MDPDMATSHLLQKAAMLERGADILMRTSAQFR